MLYHLLKIPARIAFHFYCRKFVVNDPKVFDLEGPLLIAANHPNSFLDAVILATCFNRPVTSLVRGDVYKGRLIIKILRSLKMLPVYRISEGSENLGQNYETFLMCKEVFKKNGIVLIFSEARCENKWHLRPLRKGTARLAFTAWESGIPLKVLPAGFNYHAFKRFGKIVHMNFGSIIKKESIDLSEPFGKASNNFNAILKDELSKLVYEIEDDDKAAKENIFKVEPPGFLRPLLFIPAAMGYILHAPLFLPVKLVTEKIAGWSGHFDSIMVAVLFTFYPLYLLLSGFLFRTIGIPVWLVILFPVTAYCLLHYRKPFN